MERYRILALDDEKDALDLYRRVLSEGGTDTRETLRDMGQKLFDDAGYDEPAFLPFNLTLCLKAEKAIAEIKRSLERREPFSLAYIDVRMPPGPDGIAVAERIRALDPYVQLVIVTAYSDADLKDIARRVGPPDKLFYLQKPLYSQEIQQFSVALCAKWKNEKELREIRAELEARVLERTRDLTRSERIYREVIESAAGVPYRKYYSQDGRYEFMGKGVRALLGMSAGEVTSQKIWKMTRRYVIVDPDAPPDINEYWRRFQKGDLDQYRVDLQIRTPDGKEKWISDSAVPLRDEESGRVVGSLGILQDITKRKLMEEQTRLQKEQLAQTEKLAALGALVSGVAHEINNPNNFIMLNAPVLKEAWESAAPVLEEYYRSHGDFLLGGVNYSEMKDEIPELFRGVTAGAERIRNIVKELRDFARPCPAELSEPVNVNEVVKSALTLLDNLIKKSAPSFIARYGEPMPAVMGNFQRLEQVAINLIQNACQALENPDQKIEARTEYDARRKRVRLIVRDEGRGMDAKTLRYVMDPFFTTKRERGGVGLGLSVSSKIIADHKGNLKFTSRPGQGTEAIVTLPAAEDSTNKWEE